jgi:hypothetical protein
LRDNYDFSDAVKNPFAGKIKGKYTVTVHYDFSTQDDDDESAESNDTLKVKESTQEYK